MKKTVLFVLRLYQRFLSAGTGPLRAVLPLGGCRFEPTCSVYTYQAVERYGIIDGLRLGFKRISRCHPWNKGGWDPLKTVNR